MLRRFGMSFMIAGIAMIFMPVESISFIGLIGLWAAFIWIVFGLLYLIEETILIVKGIRKAKRRG